MRLIDGDAVIEHAEVNGEDREFIRILTDYIEDADPVEPKQGEWTATGNVDEWYGPVYKCSICGSEVICDCDNFCPNCGARMERGQ